jgi:hypothetical protein
VLGGPSNRINTLPNRYSHPEPVEVVDDGRNLDLGRSPG